MKTEILKAARGLAFLACTAPALAQETLPKVPAPENDAPPARDVMRFTARGSRIINLNAALVLDKKIAEVNFDNAPLKDVLADLLGKNGGKFNVDWKALESAGMRADSPVTLQEKDAHVRKLLAAALGKQGGFYIDQGVVEITSSEIANADMLTRSYTAADLMFGMAGRGGRGPGMGAGMGPGFGPGGGPRAGQEPGNAGEPGQRPQNGERRQPGQVRDAAGARGAPGREGAPQNRPPLGMRQVDRQVAMAARFDELVNNFVDTVAPETWEINGGEGTINFADGKFIVKAPRSVHEAIGGPVN